MDRRTGRGAGRGSGAGVLRNALIALALLPWSAGAQATPPVPLDDPAYAWLDRLADQLSPEGMIHGQRPYTRLEVAHLAGEMRLALEAWERGGSPPSPERATYLRSLLEALEDRFADEVSWAGGADAPGGLAARLSGARADLSAADSPFRGFSWNGLGSADNALVNPLLDYRHGRELADGGTVAAELDGQVQVGARATAFASARMWYQAPRGAPDGDAEVRLRTAAVRAKAGRWAAQVGRGEIRRGQGRHAGLLLSANSPPLDMVTVRNEELVRIPWLHRLLGPSRFSLFLADLGPEQNFPHAKLYGNWLTFRPTSRLELGGGFVVQDGGEGGPEQSIWERIGDYLIFVDVLFQGGSDFQASNKIAGVDFRLWVPEAGATLYGEMHIDDFRVANWNHVREMLWPDAAHVLGVRMSRLDGVGRLAGWLEYQHAGIRMYRHYDYASGVTRGRFLLGTGLGSDAQAVAGGLDLAPSPWWTLSVEAAWEERSHHEWTAPEDPYFHFEKVQERPTEVRRRVQVAWDHRISGGVFGWRVEAGVERVRNFGFEEGVRERNAALRVVLDWSP